MLVGYIVANYGKIVVLYSFSNINSVDILIVLEGITWKKKS